MYAEKSVDTVALGTSLGVLALTATVIAGFVFFMKKRRWVGLLFYDEKSIIIVQYDTIIGYTSYTTKKTPKQNKNKASTQNFFPNLFSFYLSTCTKCVCVFAVSQHGYTYQGLSMFMGSNGNNSCSLSFSYFGQRLDILHFLKEGPQDSSTQSLHNWIKSGTARPKTVWLFKTFT